MSRRTRTGAIDYAGLGALMQPSPHTTTLPSSRNRIFTPRTRATQAPATPCGAPPPQSDSEYGELTDFSVVLPFELGVGLPFSRESFGRALALPTNYGWSSLREQLGSPGAEGRFGGYAFGLEGQHYVQGVGLIHLGRHGLIFPYSYESVRELDEALASGPRWRVENQEKLDKWRAENKALRPDVEWIERHRSEIDEWRLLCRIRSLLNVSLEWGGAADSLWVFIRASDLAAGNFE